MNNPYPETIIDESSGVEVPSEAHKIWEEACEAERDRIRAVASFTVRIEGKTVIVDEQDWDLLWQALNGGDNG